MKPAAHRQTRYQPAPPLDPLVVLPIPPLTEDLAQAKNDIIESGMCFLRGALAPAEVEMLRDKLDRQAEAERNLGDAVVRARHEGHSWAAIGAMVGTSGEAARQRYSQAVKAE